MCVCVCVRPTITERDGVDLIELSGGTYEGTGFKHRKESTVKRESFFLEFADEIRESNPSLAGGSTIFTPR